MNSEILEDKALLYALGTLPGDEVEEFEEMLKRDGDLRALVHESQRLMELDAKSEDSSEPPFHLLSNIMAGIEGETETASPARNPSSTGSSRVVSFLAWGGWSVAAALAVVFGAGLLVDSGSESAKPDIVVNELSSPRLVAVQPPSEEFGVEDRMLELAGLAEAYWFAREGVPAGQLLQDPDTEVAQLTGGFTIFDREYGIGFIAVENMPRETSGKSYHVWAKSGRGAEPLRAGALPIGDQSRGLFFFDLSGMPDMESVDSASFFVTEEDARDPERPSDRILLSEL